MVSYISFYLGWADHLVHIIGDSMVKYSGRSCSYSGWDRYYGSSTVPDNQVNVIVSTF